MRVAQNLGVSFGPVLGGVLLLGNAWSHLFLGMLVLAAARRDRVPLPRRAAAAIRPESRPGARLVRGRPARPAVPALHGLGGARGDDVRRIRRLLPISLVSSHGIAPSTWGFLVVVNPILVTVVQLPARRARRLASGLREARDRDAADGLPFLVLSVDDAVPWSC